MAPSGRHIIKSPQCFGFGSGPEGLGWRAHFPGNGDAPTVRYKDGGARTIVHDRAERARIAAETGGYIGPDLGARHEFDADFAPGVLNRVSHSDHIYLLAPGADLFIENSRPGLKTSVVRLGGSARPGYRGWSVGYGCRNLLDSYEKTPFSVLGRLKGPDGAVFARCAPGGHTITAAYPPHAWPTDARTVDVIVQGADHTPDEAWGWYDRDGVDNAAEHPDSYVGFLFSTLLDCFDGVDLATSVPRLMGSAGTRAVLPWPVLYPRVEGYQRWLSVYVKPEDLDAWRGAINKALTQRGAFWPRPDVGEGRVRFLRPPDQMAARKRGAK